MAKSSEKRKAKNKRKKSAMPGWARQHFDCFIQETERLTQVVELSQRGIYMITKLPGAVKALSDADRDDTGDAATKLANANKHADLAQREVESGFPVLHSWAIVGLWAHLESLVRSFVEEWIKHRPSCLKSKPFAEFKIKLGQYESIPKSERHVFIAEVFERELGVGLKNGVTRFETLLKPFGLSGEVPEALRRSIYEFGQVRNVMVHRSTKVDKKLTAACPWLKYEPGRAIPDTAILFQRFAAASLTYVTVLIIRVREKFGDDVSAQKAEVMQRASES